MSTISQIADSLAATEHRHERIRNMIGELRLVMRAGTSRTVDRHPSRVELNVWLLVIASSDAAD
jgi:hypothetical protein